MLAPGGSTCHTPVSRTSMSLLTDDQAGRIREFKKLNVAIPASATIRTWIRCCPSHLVVEHHSVIRQLRGWA